MCSTYADHSPICGRIASIKITEQTRNVWHNLAWDHPSLHTLIGYHGNVPAAIARASVTSSIIWYWSQGSDGKAGKVTVGLASCWLLPQTSVVYQPILVRAQGLREGGEPTLLFWHFLPAYFILRTEWGQHFKNVAYLTLTMLSFAITNLCTKF